MHNNHGMINTHAQTYEGEGGGSARSAPWLPAAWLAGSPNTLRHALTNLSRILSKGASSGALARRRRSVKDSSCASVMLPIKARLLPQ